MRDSECNTFKQERAMAWSVKDLIDSRIICVQDAYGKPSTTKLMIDNHLYQECVDLGGINYRILSHNGFFFTCGYFYETVDEETGEIHTWMVIHRPSRKDVYGVSRFVRIEGHNAYLTSYAFDVLDCKEEITSRFKK